MSNGLRVLLHAITGLIVGLCVVFIGVAVTLMLSFFNATAVGIPGLIDVWTTEENGATALNFNPSFVGMGVAVLVTAAAYTVLLSLATRRRAQPSQA
ncbi:hypothetical protein [uncultured Leifsonia sp.]|uniref:hypothetical protein n=1 Tax=uncultured Leifsonia sp. TaxID=340359 RepID=UPI0025DAF9A1|nr:hypothetical protein [uncultured Leifsonia sp.]